MFVRSVVGAIALTVAFGPLVAGAHSLRRRLLPGWPGPPGWLAQFVLVLTACLVAVLLLGTIGWYSLVLTTLLLAAMGVGMLVVAARVSQREGEGPRRQPERLGRPAQVVAVAALSFFAATWGARTYVALNHGMVSIDSLWYHLPQAARFAQEHSITSIYHDVPDLSGFYPINAEIFHSLGMVFLGNDLFSMVLTLGWGVVALLSAWCIGRPHGMAAVCVTGVAVLLCAPGFVGTQPGAAHNDIVGVTLFLVTAALLMSANPKRVTGNAVVLALAAMPVGFAVGTKWTLIPIAVAITLGVLVLLPRGRRPRLSAMWLAIVGALGSFSYVRNLVEVGSPLPNVDLMIGPIGWARKAPAIVGMDSVTAFVLDRAAWQEWLLPGVSRWFGYAWWAVLALVVVGLVLSIVTGPGSLTRMLGVVAVVSLVAYLVQPQLLNVRDEPVYFSANIRYASTGLAFGLVLLPLSPVFRRRALAWSLPAAFLIVILVMQLDPTIWPSELRELRWEDPVRGADAIAGVVIGLVALGLGLAFLFFGVRLRSRVAERHRSGADTDARWPTGRRPSVRSVVIAGTAIGVLLLGLVGVDRFFLAHRYARPEVATPWLTQHWRSWQWARGIEDQRIGFTNPYVAYPLYGNRLSNHVEGLPAVSTGRIGAPVDVRTRCAEFRQIVNQRRYDYVVLFGSLAPDADLPPGWFEKVVPQVGWLDSDPSVTKVLDEPLEAVFRIDGPLDPEGCSPSPT